jgi:hypothetical protein
MIDPQIIMLIYIIIMFKISFYNDQGEYDMVEVSDKFRQILKDNGLIFWETEKTTKDCKSIIFNFQSEEDLDIADSHYFSLMLNYQ